jgi:hypothetical protein
VRREGAGAAGTGPLRLAEACARIGRLAQADFGGYSGQPVYLPCLVGPRLLMFGFGPSLSFHASHG